MPALGPVGIPPDGPVGTATAGPEGIEGEGVCVGRLTGVLPLVETSAAGAVRIGGAAPQEAASGRVTRSLPNEPLPPLMLYAPRAEGT